MYNQQTIKNEEEKSGEYDTIRIKISEETSFDTQKSEMEGKRRALILIFRPATV